MKDDLKSENELAKILTVWLRQDGWEVYEEISPYGNNGPRTDLVATRGRIIWVIECKRSFSLNVIEQASRWFDKAHFTSAAVWQPKSSVGIMSQVAAKFGFGLITVKINDSRSEPFEVYEKGKSAFNRRANTAKIKAMLNYDTKASGLAGLGGKTFRTPFKQTCERISMIVRKSPGIELEEAARLAKHHYADDRKAKTNIINAISNDFIEDLQIVREGKRLLLYPAGYIFAEDPAPAQSEVSQKSLF